MHTGFTRGLIIGSVVGAAIGTMVSPQVINNKTRKRMMRTGRHLMKRSSHMLGDVIDVFR